MTSQRKLERVRRDFVANASHELRTPLAVIRTAIDVTMAKPTRTPAQLESMAGEVRDGVQRAEATVAALLALARSDQPVTAAEPTDLATAAEDALDLASARIRAAGLSIETTLDPAPVSGDAVLLERMAANIVDNAIVHNVRGGSVRVRTGLIGARAFLEAENTGAVIPDDLVPGLFEPFRRLDERTRSDSGAGIGLSIVAAVAAAHHGDVSARARAGGGLTVRIELPTTDDARPGWRTEGSDPR
jgi:signal transduction histidine kinase